MYTLPLVAVLLICLAIFFSPILAVVLVFLLLLALGVYKFLGRGTVPEHAPPPRESTTPANGPRTATTATGSEDEETGPWGETWPEQREGTPNA
jgi:hypothetical protein